MNGKEPDISHLRILACGTYVFLHEDVRKDSLSPHAELMTFIGYTDGIKGWKFMRNTNTIFSATKAVFDENTYPHCPEGSRANIPAIETGILPIDEVNIPPEDGDQQPPLPPVEEDPIWQPTWSDPYFPTGNGNGNSGHLPPYNPPSSGPVTPLMRPVPQDSDMESMYKGSLGNSTPEDIRPNEEFWGGSRLRPIHYPSIIPDTTVSMTEEQHRRLDLYRGPQGSITRNSMERFITDEQT